MNNTNINNGLNNEEVEKSREKYGNNCLTKSNSTSFIKKFIECLGDPIIKILLIALAIKTIFLFKNFDWYETIGIVIAILLASFISTISEYGSEKAFIKMQEEAAKIKCRVLRNSKIEEISVDDVVVGDIVLLNSGDKVPADGIIVDGDISVDESSLNGEAKEAYKEAIKNNLISEKNKVYRGSVVYSKSAKMLVEKVGNQTIYGGIAKELSEKSPISPLKLRLTELAKFISKIGYVAAFLISISYLFSVIVIKNNFDINLIIETITNFPVITGHLLYAMTLVVTVIIVAVPEGLPMMITLVLSSNMKRMLKNNVLVRKLMGIETAGNINILFTDKTGTLTKGKLEVIGFVSGSKKEYSNMLELKKYSKLNELLEISIVYNNESVYSDNKIIGGNITDRALLSFVNSYNKNVKVINKIPFNSKDKYSITTVDFNGKKHLIKGAPEVVMKNCKYYYDEFGNKKSFNMELFNNKIDSYTKRGIRVLALAINDNYSLEDKFKNLTLVGIVLIKDEVREDAIEGVKLVKNAHIQTVMITGDNKNTAVGIAKEVGLLENNYDIVLTSEELKMKTDEELKKIIPNLRVVARALPQDKSRLVKLSQELGLVVGMTGDGVNDAPALKKADVGFAMGSGTEVAKEASDIVILDDNFMSISKAVLFGRTIFKSIRKFIILQLTINLCAMSLSFVGPFIGIDTPITVIQMLWVNMVMDTLAGLAFAFEPPLLEYMNEYPKKKNESIMNKYMINEILFTGIYSSILCVLFLKLPIIKEIYDYYITDEYLLTAFFGLFIFIDIFNCFNARTHRINILANIMKNKVFIFIIGFITVIQLCMIYFGHNIFRTTDLTFIELQIMILLAFTVIPVDWIRKLYLKKKGKLTGV
ncbi:MAG: calcium-translocating P-type ATPase, PMCA-type [Lactobacillales bacterium]|nr:calcium-translocating P-type ATPase, PMCA-type [Lactobacillales bacterium]